MIPDLGPQREIQCLKHHTTPFSSIVRRWLDLIGRDRVRCYNPVSGRWSRPGAGGKLRLRDGIQTRLLQAEEPCLVKKLSACGGRVIVMPSLAHSRVHELDFWLGVLFVFVLWSCPLSGFGAFSLYIYTYINK